MLLKSCARCGKFIPYGLRYCKECANIVQAERDEKHAEAKKRANRAYNKRRNPKYLKFYNSKDWKTLSRRRLQNDGFRCVMCGKIASDVDHIIPIQTPEGWDKRFDYDNLRSLCLECHNKVHGRFQKKRKG